MGAKPAAICRILRYFLGPLLYMGSIAAFHWTAGVALVFYGVLQWQDIEPPQYICFSGVNLDIAMLQNLVAICKL